MLSKLLKQLRTYHMVSPDDHVICAVSGGADSIALLFGIGNAFDSVVSLVAYAFLLKKEKINILKVK